MYWLISMEIIMNCFSAKANTDHNSYLDSRVHFNKIFVFLLIYNDLKGNFKCAVTDCNTGGYKSK